MKLFLFERTITYSLQTVQEKQIYFILLYERCVGDVFLRNSLHLDVLDFLHL